MDNCIFYDISKICKTIFYTDYFDTPGNDPFVIEMIEIHNS